MSNSIYPERIKYMAEKLCIVDVYEELIRQYPQFTRWAGSHSSKLHHYEEGGLARHTYEIIAIGFDIIPSLNLQAKIPPIEFFLAALFHDTGKMYDYEEKKSEHGGGNYWQPTPHKREIYHINRSTLIFHDIISDFPDLNAKFHDAVLHDILAHHGRREFGSPVAPKSHCAWLLHLCDSISARMDDADRLDIVKGP